MQHACHACMHVCIMHALHACKMHANWHFMHACNSFMHACMHATVLCMHAVQICMYACMHIMKVHACAYICMHVFNMHANWHFMRAVHACSAYMQQKYINNIIVNKINICLNRYTVLSIDKQLSTFRKIHECK